jgi:anti-sigma-K factor RskA
VTFADDPRQARDAAGPGHVDGETLALIALGEPVSDVVSEHVARCESCRGQVESLRPVVAIGRALQPEDLVTTAPPAHVWDRIAAETGVGGAPSAPKATLVRPQQSSGRGLGDGKRQVAGQRRAPSTGTRRLAWVLAAAIVGAVVGTAGTLGWQSLHRGGPRIVASATLRPLPTKHGTGTAEVEDVNDQRELAVRVTAPPTRGEYLEVWLMSDPKHLISLGTLQSPSGRFTLPAGLDLSKYKIVDVSLEPYDGNPAHSADSLVRGSLGPT